MKKVFKFEYKPRVWQQKIHEDKHRFRVVLAHRQAGKSILAVGEIVRACILKKGVYAWIAPEKDQGKRVIWQKFKDLVRKMPGIKINETESRADFPNGSQFYILGGSDPENVRGMHFSGVILDEVADLPMDSWGLVIRPALEANKAWAIIIGTPKKGDNLLNFARKLGSDEDAVDWRTFIVDVYTSGTKSAEDIESLKREMLPSHFAQEYLMEETASEGEIYASLIEQIGERGQIGMNPYDERLPVYTGWDIGYNDYTVIWFAQQNPDTNKIYMIDFYQNRREYMSHYINYVCRKPYRYATAFLPHDIDQTRMDKEYSDVAKFNQAGLKYRVLPRTKNILQSVQSVQAQMGRVFFNKGPCEAGLKGLMMYDTKKDKKSGKYTDKLTHCDISDAFRYTLEGLQTAKLVGNSYERFKKAEMTQAQKPSSMSIAKKRLRKRR